MTNKQHLLIGFVKYFIIGLVIAGVIPFLGSFLYHNLIRNAKQEPTLKDQCFLSGSIDACVKLDKENKVSYTKLTEVLSGIANDNAKVKKHTQELLSGSSFQ